MIVNLKIHLASLPKLGLSMCLMLASLNCFAIEPYEFPNEETRDRFQQLTYELRCPKCQNQNIADSNAPIAQDLRREVHRMLMEGNDNVEIVDFMVERYGDFVMYRPPFSAQTFALWTLPVVLALLGIGLAVRMGRGRRSQTVENDELSGEEQERLQALLRQSPGSGPARDS